MLLPRSLTKNRFIESVDSTHSEYGKSGVRRGGGGGSGGRRTRTVRPEQEEVLALLGLRCAPVSQQGSLAMRLLNSGGAACVLVTRANPAPAGGTRAALGACLLLDERGERHEHIAAALAPVLMLRPYRR